MISPGGTFRAEKPTRIPPNLEPLVEIMQMPWQPLSSRSVLRQMVSFEVDSKNIHLPVVVKVHDLDFGKLHCVLHNGHHHVTAWVETMDQYQTRRKPSLNLEFHSVKIMVTR